VKYKTPYKILTWKIDRAIMSPVVGLDVTQGWPYAPYQAVITALPYIQRAFILFMALTVLTLLFLNLRIDAWQILLLAALFCLPPLVLMTGGIPLPASVSMSNFAEYQVRLLPIISLIPLLLVYFSFRKQPRTPLILILILMVFFLCIYPQVSIITDEQKRNAILGSVQIAMIVYLFGLALYNRVQGLIQNSIK